MQYDELVFKFQNSRAMSIWLMVDILFQMVLVLHQVIFYYFFLQRGVFISFGYFLAYAGVRVGVS
jgi:hypothetical protein